LFFVWNYRRNTFLITKIDSLRELWCDTKFKIVTSTRKQPSSWVLLVCRRFIKTWTSFFCSLELPSHSLWNPLHLFLVLVLLRVFLIWVFNLFNFIFTLFRKIFIRLWNLVKWLDSDSLANFFLFFRAAVLLFWNVFFDCFELFRFCGHSILFQLSSCLSYFGFLWLDRALATRLTKLAVPLHLSCFSCRTEEISGVGGDLDPNLLNFHQFSVIVLYFFNENTIDVFVPKLFQTVLVKDLVHLNIRSILLVFFLRFFKLFDSLRNSQSKLINLWTSINQGSCVFWPKVFKF